jgi:hypothetical protein
LLTRQAAARFDGNLVDRLISADPNVEVLGRSLFGHHGHSHAVLLHPDRKS